MIQCPFVETTHVGEERVVALVFEPDQGIAGELIDFFALIMEIKR